MTAEEPTAQEIDDPGGKLSRHGRSRRDAGRPCRGAPAAR
jgi:hypothetical protein